MAMAAALEGIGDDSEDDDNDDSSDIGYDDDLDGGPRLFEDDIEEEDEEDDDDDDLSEEIDGGRVVGGRISGITESELILDYDLPAEDDFDDEVTNEILLQNRISSPSVTRGGRGCGIAADVTADYEDNGLVEQAIMDRYTRDFHPQSIDYPSDHRQQQKQQLRTSGAGRSSGRRSVNRAGEDDNLSVPSHVDSECRDQFDGEDDHLIHQFARRYGALPPLSQSQQQQAPAIRKNNVGNEDTIEQVAAGPTSATTSTPPSMVPPGAMLVNTDELEDTQGDPNFIMNALDTATIRRPSFNNPRRRTSHQSYTSSTNSDLSYHSEPNVNVGAVAANTTETPTTHTTYLHPRSIAVPNADGAASDGTQSQRRRGSYRRPSGQAAAGGSGRNIGGSASGGSVMTSGSPHSGGDKSNESGPSVSRSLAHSIGSAMTFRTRKSRAPRSSASIQGRSGTGPLGSLDTAIESLRQQDSNSEWENVAAAVTIVQASEQGGASASKAKNTNKFAVNDTVLVFLTLLNVTNMDDPKDTFTIAPVNKFGYPSGSLDARTDAEKSGPYTFVLCVVKHVHFDEDDRYYTILRADTGTEQRADTGWMEPLSDPRGIEVASRAARKTLRSTQDKPEELVETTGIFQDIKYLLMDILAWPREFIVKTLLPFYRRLRGGAKIIITQLLWGESPFSCRLRLTGINILVLCSATFLFLEVINLAFLPADLDDEMAIVGA